MVCGTPSSKTSKSSRVRSRTEWFFEVTVTSTLTSVTSIFSARSWPDAAAANRRIEAVRSLRIRECLEMNRRRADADSVADLVVNGHDDAIRRAFFQMERMRLDEVAGALRAARRPCFAHGAERAHETAAFGEDRKEKVDAGHRTV